MVDYETKQKKLDFAVGTFVVIALCALVWLVYKFGDMPVEVSRWRSFNVLVQFPTAPGVQNNTPVSFCGYQIGRVTHVEPPQRMKDIKTGLVYHQALVVLSIDKKYTNIPSNVQVKMMTRGLGSSYIEFFVDPALPLKPLDPNRPETKYLVDNMVLQGSAGMTSEFFPAESQKKLDELTDSLKTLIDNGNDILGDPNNKQNIKVTLANLAQTSKQAEATLKALEKFSVSGVETSEELSRTLAQLRIILEKINSGQGTAAKFVNDAKLYESLLENSQQMDILMQEIKIFFEQLSKKGVQIKF